MWTLLSRIKDPCSLPRTASPTPTAYTHQHKETQMTRYDLRTSRELTESKSQKTSEPTPRCIFPAYSGGELGVRQRPEKKTKRL